MNYKKSLKNKMMNKKKKNTLKERRKNKIGKKNLYVPCKNDESVSNTLIQNLDLNKFKKTKCFSKECTNHALCFHYHDDTDRIRENISLNKTNYYEKHFSLKNYKKILCKNFFKINNEKEKIEIENQIDCDKKEFCPHAHSLDELRIDLLHTYEQDDDFMMFKYKTEKCPFSCIKHNTSKCVYYHNSGERRRHPITHGYSILPCKYFTYENEQLIIDLLESLINHRDILTENQIDLIKKKIIQIKSKNVLKKNCPNGKNCPFIHTQNELLYHPKLFKSVNCFDIHKNRKKPSFCEISKSFCTLENELTLFELSENEESEKNSINTNDSKSFCKNKFCSFNHDSQEYVPIQKAIQAPFYKFPYNRILPGMYFEGKSFFNSLSSNLISLKIRKIKLSQFNQNSQSMGYNKPMNPFYAQPMYSYTNQIGPITPFSVQSQNVPIQNKYSQNLYYNNIQNQNAVFDQKNQNFNWNVYNIQMNNNPYPQYNKNPNQGFPSKSSFQQMNFFRC